MNRRARTFAAMLLAGAVIGVLGACGGDDGDDDWGDSQGSSQGPDVSHEGQVEYACTLGRHVRAEHGAADRWGGPAGGVPTPPSGEPAPAGGPLAGAGAWNYPHPGV